MDRGRAREDGIMKRRWDYEREDGVYERDRRRARGGRMGKVEKMDG